MEGFPHSVHPSKNKNAVLRRPDMSLRNVWEPRHQHCWLGRDLLDTTIDLNKNSNKKTNTIKMRNKPPEAAALDVAFDSHLDVFFGVLDLECNRKAKFKEWLPKTQEIDHQMFTAKVIFQPHSLLLYAGFKAFKAVGMANLHVHTLHKKRPWNFGLGQHFATGEGTIIVLTCSWDNPPSHFLVAASQFILVWYSRQ